MITISVANQKGGTGKTTINLHLAMSLAEKGHKVVLIDNDSQGNSTLSLTKNKYTTISEVNTFDLYQDAFVNVKAESNITVLKADRNLSKIERFKDNTPLVFKKNVLSLADEFDYCLIDNPPALGMGLLSALVVSDFVYTPIEMTDFSIDGIKNLLATINGIKAKHNPNLEFIGIIPNRLNSNDPRQKEKFVKLLKAFGKKIIQTPIVLRSSIGEAVELGVPVWEIKKSAARKATVEMRAAIDFIEQSAGV